MSKKHIDIQSLLKEKYCKLDQIFLTDKQEIVVYFSNWLTGEIRRVAVSARGIIKDRLLKEFDR